MEETFLFTLLGQCYGVGELRREENRSVWDDKYGESMKMKA